MDSSRFVLTGEESSNIGISQPLAPFIGCDCSNLLPIKEAVLHGFKMIVSPAEGEDEEALPLSTELLEEIKSLLLYANSLFLDLEQEELIANKHLLSPFSFDEFAAIYLYCCQWSRPSHSLLRLMNIDLSNKKREHCKKWRYYLNHLLSAFRKLPEISLEQDLYRGVTTSTKSSFEPGSKFTEFRICSCTTKMELVQDFFFGKSGTIFSINGSRSVRSIAQIIGGEEEYIFPPTSRFEVVTVVSFPEAATLVQLKQLATLEPILNLESTVLTPESLSPMPVPYNPFSPFPPPHFNPAVARYPPMIPSPYPPMTPYHPMGPSPPFHPPLGAPPPPFHPPMGAPPPPFHPPMGHFPPFHPPMGAPPPPFNPLIGPYQLPFAPSPSLSIQSPPMFPPNVLAYSKSSSSSSSSSSFLSRSPPAYWTKELGCVDVEIDSKEGLRLCSFFEDSLDHHFGSFQVTQIQRNQNFDLWKVYSQCRSSHVSNEQVLFHSPRESIALSSILDSGIDPNYSKGGACGFGSYFADSTAFLIDSNKVLATDVPDQFQTLVARVLVGNSALGSMDARSPPSGKQSTYQLSVGGRVYCIFDRNQIFPEYVVTFQGKKVIDSSSQSVDSSSEWLLKNRFEIVSPDQVENPLIEFIESPDHPCEVLDRGQRVRGTLVGKSIRSDGGYSGKFLVEIEGSDPKCFLDLSEREIEVDSTIPIRPPWFSGGWLVRSKHARDHLMNFLQMDVEGVKNLEGKSVTFMDIFQLYRLYGVCLFFFGGAVRHALLNDFAGIRDGDVTFGVPSSQMVQIGKTSLTNVREEANGLVRWGNGVRVMEGKPIRGEIASCECVLSVSRYVVHNNLFDCLILYDFCCNAVLFDPIQEIFIDMTSFGIFDICQKILRIPVPRDRWEMWLHSNPLKILRYWKMKMLGFQPVDEITERFIIGGARSLVEAIPLESKKKFLLYNICRGQLASKTARELFEKFKGLLVNDLNVDWLREHPGEENDGQKFWDAHFADVLVFGEEK